jgi:hypothetical protein
LERKMTKGKKVGPNDAHGGCVTKKVTDQARSGSKKPVCRIYAHGIRRVAHTALCSVYGSHKILKVITNGTVHLHFGFLTDTIKIDLSNPKKKLLLHSWG